MHEFTKQNKSETELMGDNRQDRALREFKQVMEDLVYLQRTSLNIETVYLYWINRARGQFVLETRSTRNSNTMFQDRVEFTRHFLDAYKDIEEPVQLDVGRQITEDDLTHYYEELPVNYVTLLPFRNNGETIALTALESETPLLDSESEEVIFAYMNALTNVLHTYLEISDLSEDQQQWGEYEERLERLQPRMTREEILEVLMNEMQQYLMSGGVTIVTCGMQAWNVLMHSHQARMQAPVGLPLEKNSVAFDALERGSTGFGIHFNQNPKRISSREPKTEGATLAIPLMIHERRQAVVLAYDENPLNFKESTKHKLINLVRIASLKITAQERDLDVNQNLLTNTYDAYETDVWQKAADMELQRLKAGAPYQTWLGFVTLDQLSSLRTRMRLEELQSLQHKLVKLFNPGLAGVPGLIGNHTDYVYAFLVQGKDDDLVKTWFRTLQRELEEPLYLGGGREVNIAVKLGYTQLHPDLPDIQTAIKHAKEALSEAVKSSEDYYYLD